MNRGTESTALRAAPLTDQRLDDLVVAIDVLDDSLEALDASIKYWPKGHALHERFALRHASLSRARTWIARKVDAERAARAEGQPV